MHNQGGCGGSFRNRGPQGIFNQETWDEVFSGHTKEGERYQQNLKDYQAGKTRKLKTVFPDWMSKEDIESSVQRAWHKRNRIPAREQIDNSTEHKRIKFQGTDPRSGTTVEFWQNQTTGEVETDYPVFRK